MTKIDAFGLTHAGKVRKNNQDNFLIAALHKKMEVHLTSLPDRDQLAAAERLAFLAMVLDQRWGDVGLLCSDGLTKHIPDDRIRERLVSMTSARQVCEALLQDALDAGGSDNVTILVGRSVRKD